jgi:hypothetical protein
LNPLPPPGAARILPTGADSGCSVRDPVLSFHFAGLGVVLPGVGGAMLSMVSRMRTLGPFTCSAVDAVPDGADDA